MITKRILAATLTAASLAACGTEPAPMIEEVSAAPATEMLGASTQGDARGLSTDFRAATNRVLPAVARIDVVSRATTTTTRGAPRLPQLPFDMPGLPGLPERGQGAPMRAGTGSGFVFDATGLVMTNRHVVDGAERVNVRLSDGREFGATVVGADANTDIAVLRLDVPEGTSLPVAALGEADMMAVGDWVLAVGSPLGLDFSVTAGIVSATGRSIGILAREGDAPLEAFIQTDAAINPGNSGGPLVDLDGRVIGVNTAIESPTGSFAGYGFAVPIDLARKVANDLVQYGEVRRPRLGVQVANATDADAKVFDLPSVSGAVVRMVQSGTAADRAGVRMGDVIVALDGRAVADASALTTTLAEHQPGDELTIGIIRYGERLDVEVELEQFTRSASPLAERGSAARGADLLGFDVQPLTPDLARRLNIDAAGGLVVTSVQPMSAAAAAGVRPGQVVKSVDGRDVESAADLERVRSGIEAGDAVSLVVSSGGNDVILNFIARR